MMGHPNAADWWAGQGGNEYLERNRVDWTARVPFWKKVVQRTFPGLVFELGCNAGWNLRAIQACKLKVSTVGVDLNEDAVAEARANGLVVYQENVHQALEHFGPGMFDLTFTAGCLIHVPPAELKATMRDLVKLSNRYVLAIEYAAEQETEIEYRGERNLLWKRPYGHLYRDLGLKFVDSCDAGEGFDNCTAWLLEKQK